MNAPNVRKTLNLLILFACLALVVLGVLGHAFVTRQEPLFLVGKHLSTIPRLNEEQALLLIDSVNVAVCLSDAVKEVVTEKEVQEAVEAVLRKGMVPLVEPQGARVRLTYFVDGIWNDTNRAALCYSCRLTISKPVILTSPHMNCWTTGITWVNGNIAVTAADTAHRSLLENARVGTERFVGKFLNAHSTHLAIR